MLESFSISIEKNFSFFIFFQFMASTEHVWEITSRNFAENTSFSCDIMRSSYIKLYHLLINLRQFINPSFFLFPFELFISHLFKLLCIILLSFYFIVNYWFGFISCWIKDISNILINFVLNKFKLNFYLEKIFLYLHNGVC